MFARYRRHIGVGRRIRTLRSSCERERLRRGPVRAALFRVFDLAAGLAGKAPLDLTPAELIGAAALEPGSEEERSMPSIGFSAI